ncbi:MAG TPA: GNAT family N-acetyltransferase [Luteimonas sp.]|nr:GNAT family N-acetyltransferase [Luteimonas sp.]
MDGNESEHPIEHRLGSAFEASFPEGRALLEYSSSAGRMVIMHTGVPPALRGRGLAGQLVRAALEYARAQGLAVEPRCSYAAEWIRRHPGYGDLLVPGSAHT